MSQPHLRQHDGGRPSQGPPPDVANPDPPPSYGSDFPDKPEPSSTGDPQDKPDLDDFAAKFGLTDDDESTSDGDRNVEATSSGEPVVTRVRARGVGLARRAAGALASGLGSLSHRLGRFADGGEGSRSDH